MQNDRVSGSLNSMLVGKYCSLDQEKFSLKTIYVLLLVYCGCILKYDI